MCKHADIASGVVALADRELRKKLILSPSLSLPFAHPNALYLSPFISFCLALVETIHKFVQIN